MPKNTKRGPKTETLSLRIDPKTKFVLDFMVRVTGRRVTDLIERAVKKYAQEVTVGGGRYSSSQKTWQSYWHPNEGYRWIALLSDPDVETTLDEEELKEFLVKHRRLFEDDNERLHSEYVHV